MSHSSLTNICLSVYVRSLTMFLKRVFLILRKMKNLKQTKLSFYEKMNEIHECALYLENFIKHELNLQSMIWKCFP